MGGTSLAMRARQILRDRDDAAIRAGRDPHGIRLVAVTKGHDLAEIRQAVALGLLTFGENYVQEWQSKLEKLKDLPIEWHFIGQLQTNKVKAVVGQVALIHAIDRDSVAAAVSRRAEALGIEQDVLIEVNVGLENSKAGVLPNDGARRIAEWEKLPGLRLCGLMIMPPQGRDAEASRPYFRQAAKWLKEWRPSMDRHPWRDLSMGTSQDFTVAVHEGATILRLGTVLFGPRLPKEKE
jgi:PLP dependent protein